MEADLLEKQKALQKLIEEAPKRKQELQRRQEKERKLKAQTMSARHDVPGVLQDDRFGRAPMRPRRRTLKKEQRAAQMRFLLLCVVLLSILILLWRALPV